MVPLDPFPVSHGPIRWMLFGAYTNSSLLLSSIRRHIYTHSNIAEAMLRWIHKASHKSPSSGNHSKDFGAPSPCYESSCGLEWQANEAFFRFTRGRFVSNEEFEISQRCVHFNMDKLAQIAASTADSRCCVAIEKYPDGQYTKAFLMIMEDGKQVVAKVPSPNAGQGQLTTASEVATMEFVMLMTLLWPTVLISYRPAMFSRLQSQRFTPGIRKPTATLWGPSTSSCKMLPVFSLNMYGPRWNWKTVWRSSNRSCATKKNGPQPRLGTLGASTLPTT